MRYRLRICGNAFNLIVDSNSKVNIDYIIAEVDLEINEQKATVRLGMQYFIHINIKYYGTISVKRH